MANLTNQEQRNLTISLNTFFQSKRIDASVQSLFDPVQTHGVYGLKDSKDTIEAVKTLLKEHGCKRFRKTGRILCFDATNFKPE